MSEKINILEHLRDFNKENTQEEITSNFVCVNDSYLVLYSNNTWQLANDVALSEIIDLINNLHKEKQYNIEGVAIVGYRKLFTIIPTKEHAESLILIPQQSVVEPVPKWVRMLERLAELTNLILTNTSHGVAINPEYFEEYNELVRWNKNKENQISE